MSKYYDKTAASFKSVTIDTKVLDAQKILVKPSTGDSTERVNILDLINEAGESVDTTELEQRISALEDVVEGYKSVEFKSNTTGNSNETEGIAMQFSKAHFIPGNAQLQQVSLPFTQAVKTLTDQYCHIAYYNDAEEVIATHISNTTQSRTQGQTGKSTWTFPESCIVPENYKYVRVLLSGVDYAVNFGVTSKYRINVVNNNGVDFDDDECCVWTSTSNSPNYLGDIEVTYGVYETILDTITSQIIIGEIKWFSGSSVPSGFLLCNGSTVSRTTYSALFEAIGTTWGEGDGSTTFALPNLIDRVAWGGTASGVYKDAGLPNIMGTFSVDINTGEYYTPLTSGAFTYTHGGDQGATGDGTSSANFTFNASRYNPIYGASNTVQPPAATLLPIIKY